MRILRFAILLLLVILLSIGTLTGCNHLRNARAITDVNQLDGQRIGVALSWAPDYLLSNREDMTLMRYNTVADMVTALCFHCVDAIAIEQALVPHVLQCVQGVRLIETPLAQDGNTVLFSNGNEDILQQFNDFIKEFQQTPEFADLQRRSKDINGYTPVFVPDAVNATRELTMCIVDDAFPYSYIDFETGEPCGIDVEMVRRFAYAYGYHLNVISGTWLAMDMSVCSGACDIGVGGISDLYRGDYEMLELCLVSDIYMYMDIFFIEVADPEQLAIITPIEE